MTKKDYIAIAKAIAGQRVHHDAVNMRLDALVEDLSTYFEQDNPRFDRKLFAEVAMTEARYEPS